MHTRRAFLSDIFSSAAALKVGSAPGILKARPKVVIIGGGAGGAVAAKSLAIAGSDLDIILIERSKEYLCAFNSNMFIGGLAPFESLICNYEDLIAKHGVKVIRANARSIDRARRQIFLEDGSSLFYDRLIVSPGVELDYRSVPGWGAEFERIMPHGWQGAGQILTLKAKLDAVEDGGLIVMVAPPDPYCCPPGPYERASMFARELVKSGRRKCKIVILDPKQKFAMQGLFEEAWETIYPGMVEWLDSSIYEAIERVDPGAGTIVTGFSTYRNISLANIVPRQTAGAIAQRAALTDRTGYCPVNPKDMRSTLDQNIHVIGDACDAGDMPKSAFAAACQAEIAAAFICADLARVKTESPQLQSTCWSALSEDDVIKVSSEFGVRSGRIFLMRSHVSQPGEPALVRKRNMAEKKYWFQQVRSQMFR